MKSKERSNWKCEVEGALVTGVTGVTGGWAGDLLGSLPPRTTQNGSGWKGCKFSLGLDGFSSSASSRMPLIEGIHL